MINKENRYQKLLEEKLNLLHSEEWDWMSEEEQDKLANEILDLQDYIEEKAKKPEYERIADEINAMDWKKIAKMSPEEHKKLWELRKAIEEAREEAELERIKEKTREAREEIEEIEKKREALGQPPLSEEEREEKFEQIRLDKLNES